MSKEDNGMGYGVQIKNALIVFSVTLIATFFTNYITFDSGEVTVGDAYNINGKYYIPIVIVNFDEKLINGINFRIPFGLKTEDIVTNRVMNVERLKSDSKENFKVISVSLVQGGVTSRILLPVDSSDNVGDIKVLNSRDLGLKVKNDYSAYSIWKKSAILAVVGSITYVIFFLLWSYSYNLKKLKILKEIDDNKDIFNKKKKELTDKSESLESQLNEFKDEFYRESNDQKNEFDKLKRNHYKTKFYLLRSVSQHKKEINFWRNVMKSVMLSGGSNKKSTDVFFREVAKSLGTYSTLGKLEVEYEHLKNLEEIMSEFREAE